MEKYILLALVFEIWESGLKEVKLIQFSQDESFKSYAVVLARIGPKIYLYLPDDVSGLVGRVLHTSFEPRAHGALYTKNYTLKKEKKQSPSFKNFKAKPEKYIFIKLFL